MLETLLNNSVSIIAGLTFAIVGLLYFRKNQKEKIFDRQSIRSRFNQVLENIAIKLLTAAAIALVISMVSFREIWLTDVFHVVFLTMLLGRHVYKGVIYVTGMNYRVLK